MGSSKNIHRIWTWVCDAWNPAITEAALIPPFHAFMAVYGLARYRRKQLERDRPA